MKNINKNSLLILSGVLLTFGLGLAAPMATFAATTPSLGYAATYGILASTFTDDTPSASTINGDIGFTTGSGATSSFLGAQINFGSNPPYSAAGSDEGVAVPALAAEPCTFTFAGAVDLATDITHASTTGTYAPGVYCSTGAMDVGGAITLSGSGTYIFRPEGSSALNSDSNASVSLTNGASACDVFWTPGAATTLGANTTFMGTDIDASGITVGAATTWSGRALAFGGTVTIDADTITVPSCAAPATLHVIKLIVLNNGGTVAPSAFTIHVEDASGTDVFGSPAPGAAAPGTLYSLTAGTYSISENTAAGYTQSFSGDCDANGNVPLSAGDNKICTIINTNIPPPAVVNNSGGSSGGGGSIVPLIGITKVPTPLALSAGPGQVTYAYTVWNVGGAAPLNNVTVTDNKCAPVTYVSGDANSNGLLDPGEAWVYTCQTNVTASTMNTATAEGTANGITAIGYAFATVLVAAPGLPNTGFPPEGNVVSWIALIVAGLSAAALFYFIEKKRAAKR
jgi:hypothetical protein